jgi:hypothetical protein
MEAFAAFVCIGAAVWALRRLYGLGAVSMVGFQLEFLRDPCLAFAVLARSPLWLVCEEDPDSLKPRPGMSGPYIQEVGGIRVGTYIRDRDRIIEALDHVRAECRRIRQEERRGLSA